MAATGVEGSSHAARGGVDGKYIGSGDPGPYGGGTYTSSGMEPTLQDYENVFGPAARDIKFDTQRSKRHQRWHLPDVLKGPNPWLTDRVDGLITDATSSPFTSTILPYRYVENPDAKLKWNVWSFDEGMASRVPYESAARVLTQTKKSFAGYTVRQGLAITMEHNFMKSAAGMENFRNQLKQMVGSIQYSNDFDVHMALISAPSYARTIAEKYFSSNKNPSQIIREYIDLFGIMQKNPNALDLLIEEAKAVLKNWGAKEPTFLLTNSKLTVQLQMSPERTNYVTQGYDGIKRLRTGPNIDSYRNLSIIKSRAFSLDDGVQPRDVLRRRVRVAEYYRIVPGLNFPAYQLYDESKDTWFTLTVEDLYKMSEINSSTYDGYNHSTGGGNDASAYGYGPGNAHASETVAQYPNQPRNPSARVSFAARQLTVRKEDTAVGTAVGTAIDTAAYTNMEDPISLTSKAWFDSPYNNKIALFASMGSVHLGGQQESGKLVCGTVYYDATERKFAQTISQGTNHITTETETSRAAYVCASAWIGGGLFCDTTYHFCPKNSLKKPLCNWSSLDVTRESEEKEDEFKPYQPNNFKFEWKNQHSKQNLIGDDSREYTQEQVVAACFANIELDNNTCEILLASCGLPVKEVARKCYLFLVPYTSETNNNNHHEMRGLETKLQDLSDKGLNPWKTVLMTLFMSVLHPEQEIRDSCRSVLRNMCCFNSDNFGEDLRHLLRKYGESDTRENLCLADDIRNVMKRNFHGPSRNNGLMDKIECDMKPGHVGDVDTQKATLSKACRDMPTADIVRIFAMTVAKRIFWGASRFNANEGNAYGLSILSRQFARLSRNPSPTVAFDVDDKGVSGMRQTTTHRDFKADNQWDTLSAPMQYEYVIVRPNIEHEMLGVIIGRGGMEDLGATLWGQTELSCYDDSQHGVWGMSYKYHERAQVFNEKSMIRLWDIAFDGYNGGMDDQALAWNDEESVNSFKRDTNTISKPYSGVSLFVMRFKRDENRTSTRNWPNPVVFYEKGEPSETATVDPECIHNVFDDKMRVFHDRELYPEYDAYRNKLPDFSQQSRIRKPAGLASATDETSSVSKLAFQGSLRGVLPTGQTVDLQSGCGHLGPSYVGVASVREGKGYKQQGAPMLGRLV